MTIKYPPPYGLVCPGPDHFFVTAYTVLASFSDSLRQGCDLGLGVYGIPYGSLGSTF